MPRSNGSWRKNATIWIFGIALVAVLVTGFVFETFDIGQDKFYASQPVEYSQLDSFSTGGVYAVVKGSIYETGENMTVFGACLDAGGDLLEESTATLQAWYPNGTVMLEATDAIPIIDIDAVAIGDPVYEDVLDGLSTWDISSGTFKSGRHGYEIVPLTDVAIGRLNTSNDGDPGPPTTAYIVNGTSPYAVLDTVAISGSVADFGGYVLYAGETYFITIDAGGSPYDPKSTNPYTPGVGQLENVTYPMGGDHITWTGTVEGTTVNTGGFGKYLYGFRYLEVSPFVAGPTGRFRIHITMPDTIGTYFTEFNCTYGQDWATDYGEWQNPAWVKRIGDLQLSIANVTTILDGHTTQLANITSNLYNFSQDVNQNFSDVLTAIDDLNISVGEGEVQDERQINELRELVHAISTSLWVIDETNPTYSLSSGVFNYEAVDMVSPYDVYAASSDGRIVRWDGETWTTGSVNGTNLLGVSAVTAALPYAWYVGTNTSNAVPIYSING
ncbi:hypothetical protein GOV11_03465, partial [Candidatus Woesearchaeota archaeon]|nr:hypothetical protein [Candidatus Woesearchaeota archaeon]